MSNDAFYNKVKEEINRIVRRYDENGYKVNLAGITDIIINQYHIDTSYTIIKSIFNTKDNPKSNRIRKIPLAELAAICDILQVPMSEICKFDTTPTKELVPSWLIPRKTNRESLPEVLTNPFYYGKYYCYYFKTKPISNAKLGNKFAAQEADLRTATLEISEKHGFSYATLTETSDTPNFSKEGVLCHFVCEGKIYYLSERNQAYAALMDEDGKRIVCLMFDFHNYTKDVMFYRTAAMLTTSTEQYPRPIYEKIVLLRTELDLKDEYHQRILRGMLTLESNKLLVKKQDYECLVKKNPDLQKFNSQTDEYLTFIESEILNQHNDLDYEQKKELILLLRQNSYLNIQNVAGEDYDFADMVRHIQQRAKKPKE